MGEDGEKVMITVETLTRGLYWVAYYWFARHLPRNYVKYSMGSKRIRAFVCRKLFKKFGCNVCIEPKVIFSNMSQSEIGDNSGIGLNSIVGTVKIGHDVMIGEELIVISRNHDFSDMLIPMTQQGWTEDRPVVIEDDVWVGSRVIMLPGVRIGTGSIVGAGSVVTKDVEPYAIVAGNPARKIRFRFETLETAGASCTQTKVKQLEASRA